MKTIVATLLILILPSLIGLEGSAHGRTSSVSVVLQVRVGDRDPAQMRIAEETIGTVTLPTGRNLGFRPRVDGTGLEIRVLERTGNEAGAPVVWTETERFRVSAGSIVQLERDNLAIAVEWLGLASVDEQPDSLPECCVTCDGVRYCACAVRAACADCCASACCNSPSATCSVATVGARVDVPSTRLSTRGAVARRK